MTRSWRDFQQPGRSEAIGINGMVATSHAQATLAALDTLRTGGNAIDAAVCAAAMLAVVDPTQTGIGGDCFILLAPNGTGPIVALDGSGWAPRAAGTDWYIAHGYSAIAWNTPHAVTIPGAVSAWDRIVADYGKSGLARVLQPAIEAAESGYGVTERVAHDWQRKETKLSANAQAAATLLLDGRAPRFGTIHRQPALAASLRAIAQQGSKVFYQGWIAEDIVGTLRALDGLHTLDDFAEYRAEYVTAINASYRGHDIWQCPPAGVGVVALIMARVLERFDLASLSPLSAAWTHLVGEAGRLAYATRNAVLGDPRTGRVPLDELLSDAFIARLASRIDPQRRLDALPQLELPQHRDTALVSVVDRDRNAVALINSNCDDFGSGIVTQRSGIVLQNRGCGFAICPGHPNTIEGRKRPLHTIIPALLTRGGRAVAAFGVTGGQFQPSGQFQLLSHLIDHGLDLQAAVDQPRAFSTEFEIELEASMPNSVAIELRRMGYNPVAAKDPLGTAHAVMIDWDSGVLHGAADGRRDGLALGW